MGFGHPLNSARLAPKDSQDAIDVHILSALPPPIESPRCKPRKHFRRTNSVNQRVNDHSPAGDKVGTRQYLLDERVKTAIKAAPRKVQHRLVYLSLDGFLLDNS